MRGLKISRIPKGVLFEQERLQERLFIDFYNSFPERDTPEAWFERLYSYEISEFSRFFGPIFPDFLERKWLLCSHDMDLLDYPFYSIYETGFTSGPLEELNTLEFSSGDGWRIVQGEYLVRVANHLNEWDLECFGIPSVGWLDFQNLANGLETTEELQALAKRFCDIVLLNYEGIWGAFFDNLKLLARTFFHCSENFIVLEIDEDIDLQRDWLTKCRLSCPNLPLLLRVRHAGLQGSD